MALKDDIKKLLQDMKQIQDEKQDTDEVFATRLATIIKTSLTKIVNQSVPIPQDGGANLKTTMLTAIQSL